MDSSFSSSEEETEESPLVPLSQDTVALAQQYGEEDQLVRSLNAEKSRNKRDKDASWLDRFRRGREINHDLEDEKKVKKKTEKRLTKAVDAEDGAPVPHHRFPLLHPQDRKREIAHRRDVGDRLLPQPGVTPKAAYQSMGHDYRPTIASRKAQLFDKTEAYRKEHSTTTTSSGEEGKANLIEGGLGVGEMAERLEAPHALEGLEATSELGFGVNALSAIKHGANAIKLRRQTGGDAAEKEQREDEMKEEEHEALLKGGTAVVQGGVAAQHGLELANNPLAAEALGHGLGPLGAAMSFAEGTESLVHAKKQLHNQRELSHAKNDARAEGLELQYPARNLARSSARRVGHHLVDATTSYASGVTSALNTVPTPATEGAKIATSIVKGGTEIGHLAHHEYERERNEHNRKKAAKGDGEKGATKAKEELVKKDSRVGITGTMMALGSDNPREREIARQAVEGVGVGHQALEEGDEHEVSALLAKKLELEPDKPSMKSRVTGKLKSVKSKLSEKFKKKQGYEKTPDSEQDEEQDEDEKTD